jgi:hypothetical protein
MKFIEDFKNFDIYNKFFLRGKARKLLIYNSHHNLKFNETTSVLILMK